MQMLVFECGMTVVDSSVVVVLRLSCCQRLFPRVEVGDARSELHLAVCFGSVATTRLTHN
jgi:hypothetical protein